MRDELLKTVLEGQVECFKSLSRQNAETFADYDDAYFKGKSQAYLLAAQAFENIVVDFFGGSYNADNEN
jgi:hypothetical protein